MRAPLGWRRFPLPLCRILGFLFLTGSPAKADGISFQLTAATLTATSNGTATFAGSITNGSSADLNASDFFFNFFAFDPTSLNPIQDLGVLTDFSIPNASTSANVSLFDVMVSNVPAGTSFSLEAQLEDGNLDTSATQTVTITVPGTQSISEPHTELLLLAGLLPLALWKLRRA